MREGRRREFASFGGFQDPEQREKIPDPNDEETFDRSHPEPLAGEHAKAWAARTRELLALRQEAIVPRLKAGLVSAKAAAVGERGVEAEWHFGDHSVLRLHAQLGPEEAGGFSGPVGRPLHVSAPDIDKTLASGKMPAWSVAWFLERP